MAIDFPVQEQRRLLAAACEAVLGHGLRVRDLPVSPTSDVGQIRHAIDNFDLEAGGEPISVIEGVSDLLESGTVLTTHPRYFGLFNPTPLTAAIAADILTAGFNPQLAVWSHAPAAVEIEARLVREVGGWLGMDDVAGSFTSGGTEANLTAAVLALHTRFPDVKIRGIQSIPERPTIYTSSESHLSWLRIAHVIGIGRDAVRMVPCDESFRLNVNLLREMMWRDRAEGSAPFMVIATAGTTAGGVIDPIDATAVVADEQGAWFHVDAAWAGAAAASPTLGIHLRGVERADSVTVDAHKWLSVPMGAGMIITRHRNTLRHAFDISASYMPPPVSGVADDPYVTSVQWSRRAAGLKLFLSLAIHGRQGYRQQIEHDVRLGVELREALEADGWLLMNSTPLPIACVVDPTRIDDAPFHDALAAAVVDSGDAWISSVNLASVRAIRACVISHRTTQADISALVSAMSRARTSAHAS